MHADDTTMYHAADTPEELGAALEGDLNGLADWVSDNRLNLNENKTQLLLHSGRVKPMNWKKSKWPFKDTAFRDVQVLSAWG